MSVERIDALMMKKCFLAGAKALEARKDYINELNVFPVPDGDTGTNMTMTIMAAVREINKITDVTVDNLCKAMSSGSLRGARGNSGVILSQIFRGFTKELKGLEYLEVTDLGNSIQHAADTAYKAVMKPKEGTILTVIKAGAERSVELLMEGESQDMVAFAEKVVAYMEDTLKRTPDMLPVLKQAGVVDSGGEGLMTFVRGALAALQGKEVDLDISGVDAKASPAITTGSSEDAADIKFGYCTEFIIMLERDQDKVEKELKAYLQDIGDCVVVVADDEIVKVHVHTNHPGLAFEKALTYGSLTSMKIDNMREEHQEKLIRDAETVAKQQAEEDQREDEPKEHKADGFVVVSAGDGLSDIFKDLGADEVIEGGQTMNPSTEDILQAVEKVPADTVYILPNNGNIILAAEQARNLTEDKKVVVIPSTNIPQGIAAMINFMPGQPAEENTQQMTEEMGNVKSGQVTYAVRDTRMDGQEIKQGDYMGIADKKIVAVEKSLPEVTVELVEGMIDEESELVSLYYGADVTEKDAEAVADLILKDHDDLEVEVQYGGQPVYSYFVSVE
ncbi:DAK2 domain-containing protein [Jutongia sp.]|uniref:DAK2 domain-containing protein n=1 Tax=Jutongia sp. TaxID=2944204 RepID=UPI00307963BD|nr:DAK2 domain-containing protein [Clostridium sp.]